MKAFIKFTQNSLYYRNGIKQEQHEDVQEFHYNYAESNRLAIECHDTGYTYNINDIVEIEIKE